MRRGPRHERAQGGRNVRTGAPFPRALLTLIVKDLYLSPQGGRPADRFEEPVLVDLAVDRDRGAGFETRRDTRKASIESIDVPTVEMDMGAALPGDLTDDGAADYVPGRELGAYRNHFDVPVEARS